MIIEHEHAFMEKQEAWAQQEAIFKKMITQGMDVYLRSLPEYENAFVEGEQPLCCMDEGIPKGDFRSAGSGILVEGEERTVFIQSLKDAGVEHVTSHTGCGAAALYRELHGITEQTVDEVAIAGAKKIAQEIGVPYGGHIETLTRPKEFHQARVIYVDGTGHFNPSKVEGLLPGFVISRKFMSPSQAAFEVGIAIAIAFGHHGFAEKFTAEYPLILVALGDEEQEELSAVRLQQEIELAIQHRSDTHAANRSRIRFDHASTPFESVFRQAA